MEHHCVVEVEEEVLAVGAGVRQRVTVQQRGTGREPALGAADGKSFAREDVAELLCKAPYRVAFRHYSMTSPVVS
jgi:hypothetical protein